MKMDLMIIALQRYIDDIIIACRWSYNFVYRRSHGGCIAKRSWWRWIIWLRWLWICWMVMMVMITSLMTMMNVNIGSDASWNFYHLLKYQGGVPPCDIIVVDCGFIDPSSQNDCCPIRNCTSRPPRMLQWECFTTCKTFATAFFWFTTWHNLLIYLAQSLRWALLQCLRLPATQLSREEREASRPCESISPYCDYIL